MRIPSQKEDILKTRGTKKGQKPFYPMYLQIGLVLIELSTLTNRGKRLAKMLKLD